DADFAEVTFALRTLLTLAENVAGWYWLRGRDTASLLRFFTIRAITDSDETVRIGALRMIRLIASLPAGVDARKFFESVLADREATVRRAGLQLLESIAADVVDVIEILEGLES